MRNVRTSPSRKWKETGNKYIEHEFYLQNFYRNSPNKVVQLSIYFITMESYMDDNILKVGKYNTKFNDILGLDIAELDIYRSKGLPTHMVKSKHFKALKYIDYIPDIIEAPDYVGINPNENGTESVELIKRYRDNILVGIKLDEENGYLYVSTMHDIQEGKISRRLYSGRIKEFSVDKNEEK